LQPQSLVIPGKGCSTAAVNFHCFKNGLLADLWEKS